MNIFDYKLQKFVFTNHDDYARNEMYIGGPFYNKRTKFYFDKYFPQFVMYVDENLKEANIATQRVEYSHNKFGFELSEDTFFETIEDTKDYAFFVKLIPKDLIVEIRK